MMMMIYMWVCLYVCVCVSMYIHTYIYIYICVCVCVCECVHTAVLMYVDYYYYYYSVKSLVILSKSQVIPNFLHALALFSESFNHLSKFYFSLLDSLFVFSFQAKRYEISDFDIKHKYDFL